MEGNIKPVSNPWNRPFKVGDTIKRPNGKELYQISSYGTHIPKTYLEYD